MSTPQPYVCRVLATVDSTNAEAARIASEVTAPTWILGLTQTAARGRRGRPWAHPPGNFAATLVLPSNDPPAVLALRSFCAAVALYEAFVACTGRSDGLALKWPNDVLLNGGKIAGILLETLPLPGGGQHLAIGIGVNLKTAPGTDQIEPQALRPVSLMSETGADVSPEAFLDALAGAFARSEAQLSMYGFEPIRTAWLARAARLGEVITARMPSREITGTFETVDAQGNLVLKTPKGRETIAAAEISF